jgi:hypothetical protein
MFEKREEGEVRGAESVTLVGCSRGCGRRSENDEVCWWGGAETLVAGGRATVLRCAKPSSRKLKVALDGGAAVN